MQLLVQQITPTEEEKSAPYWKAMFDKGTNTEESEGKGLVDIDLDYEATPSSKAKGKAKTRHQDKGHNFYLQCKRCRSITHAYNGVKFNGDLGEGQVVYLGEEDDDMKVSKHNGQNKEGFDVNEPTGPSNFKLLLNKGMQQKRINECNLYTLSPVSNPWGKKRRRKVGDS
ncbi:hypothetical protein DVH24_005777 [Malus domestica]|uniref:Uncharacterized protein n=1 Tax=Malus domestica TaxID=3750 RepID=A0A498IMW4_MALDO|nr:hypothetical protein DVH24_005777 [Malus domestica]